MGSPAQAEYPAYLNLGSGTHFITTSISKAYSGTPTGLLSLLLSSSTVNCSGSINLTNITLNAGTSTVNMQDSSGAKSIRSASQEFNHLNFNDNDTSWTLEDDLTLKGDLTLSAGTFVHNNKKVIISGSGTSCISGVFTFYDFECTSQGKEIDFEQTKTQTVAGTFTITGGTGGQIELFSQSAGSKWFLDPVNASVSYATIKDSTTLKTIVALDSIDSGNNTGWIIGGSLNVTAPITDDILYVGDPVDISWATVSGISKVNLYYATNASAGELTWKKITPTPIDNNSGASTTHPWVVEDDISADCAIKVVAVVDGAEVSGLDDTSGKFKIMGTVLLSYPNVEGIGWPVDTQRRIEWTTVGTVADIKVYCSTQGGAVGTWDDIGTIGTNKYYDWTPSDKYGGSFTSDDCYIKITDSRYEDIVDDVSDYKFKIGTGGLKDVMATDLNDVGKTVLASGSSYRVRWATLGAVSAVDIAYSIDGGTFTPIAVSVTNDGKYDGVDDDGPWIIEHALSDEVLVRVSDSADADVFAKTETIAIQAPFTITAPEEAETLLGGGDKEIKWETLAGLTIANVKIEYSLTGEAPWTEINEGSYTATNDWSELWSVPTQSATAVKIRITDAADTTGFAYADSAAFKVKRGQVTVKIPNTAVIWKVGEGHEIEWLATGDVTSVKLYYCIDGDQPTPDWKPVDDDGSGRAVPIDAALAKYMWAIPDDVSAQCLVKVEDADDPDIFDVSDALFTIRPILRLTVPNGGQNWVVGNSYDIKWTTTGTIDDVKLEYSANGGGAWNDIGTPPITNINSKSWTVPEAALSANNCLVKVSSYLDSAVFDKSDNPFTVSLATIDITSPAEGDIWVQGDNKEIVWDSDGTVNDNLTIEYSASGNFTDAVELGSSETNDKSFWWNITEGISTSTTAKVRIKDMTWAAKGKDVSDTSAEFELAEPRIDLVQPVGGERLKAEGSYEIKWTSRGSAISNKVKIEYSKLGDFTDAVVIDTTADDVNDGSFLWTNIDDAISDTVKLRVYDANNLTLYGESADVFSIVGVLGISSPAAETTLYVSKDAAIGWTTAGTIGDVNLSYSKTGEGAEAVWYNMDDEKLGDVGVEPTQVTNGETYTWTIPDIVYTDNSPNPNVFFKVEDPNDSLVYSTRRFTVSYYTIVWSVTDLDGLVGHLGALSVISTDVASGTQFENRSGLSSPVSLYYYPDKSYNSVWSRNAFLDTSLEGWVADSNDKKLSIKMPAKLIEKVRKVYTEIYYDADADLLSLTAWLQEQEKMIPKENLSAEIFGVTEVFIEIFDSSDNVIISSDSVTESALNTTGVFMAKWADLKANGKIAGGNRYFIRVRIIYQGAYHWGGVSFEITEALDLHTIAEQVKAGGGLEGKIESQTGLTRTAVTAAKTSIESEVATKAAATQTAVTAKATETMTLIGSEDLKTGETLASTLSRESASRILNQESHIRINDTLTIRYKTTTGLSPTVTVYDPADKKRIDAKKMTETVSGTGIYEYDVTFSWGKGTHTVICQETTKGTLDGINIEVISTDLDSIANTATTTMAQLANIDTDQMELLSGSIEDINGVISRIVNNIDELAGLSAKVQDLAGKTTEAIYEQLEIAARKLREINEGQGVKIEKMYDLSEEQSTDMDYVKNKTLEIKALTELTQAILSRTSDVPVVKTWME